MIIGGIVDLYFGYGVDIDVGVKEGNGAVGVSWYIGRGVDTEVGRGLDEGVGSGAGIDIDIRNWFGSDEDENHEL